MADPFKAGERVRVYATPGIGKVPDQGATGTVEGQLDNGNVVVKLDDGTRGIFASWECKREKDLS